MRAYTASPGAAESLYEKLIEHPVPVKDEVAQETEKTVNKKRSAAEAAVLFTKDIINLLCLLF